jgi:hypothetical protein
MVTIKEIYKDDKQGSVAEVVIGEENKEVRFWGSIVNVIGEGQELEAYIMFLYYKELDDIETAKQQVQSFASGENSVVTSEVEVDGRIYFSSTGYDTRNWAQQIIDNN